MLETRKGSSVNDCQLVVMEIENQEVGDAGEWHGEEVLNTVVL